MSTISARMLPMAYCLMCLAITAIPVRADDPPTQKSVRLDAVGDPLPEGAVARLGTLRLVHVGSVAAVAVSPDGKLLASGVHYPSTLKRLADGPDQTESADPMTQTKPRGIRLWDTRTGKPIRELQTPEPHTSCLLFGADGADLFGVCGNQLACWNPHTGEQRWQKGPPNEGPLHTPLRASTLILAGDRLISIHSGSHSCKISGKNWSSGTSHPHMAVRIWNRKTGELAPLPAALESTNIVGKDIPVMFHRVAVSADGRFAAVISSYARSPLMPTEPMKGAEKDEKRGSWQYANPRLRIIDLGTSLVRHDLPATIHEGTQMAFRDDGSLLAIAEPNDLWILDIATGNKTRVAVDVPSLQHLHFIPGTQQIALQLADQAIRVWDYKTGRAMDRHTVRNDQLHGNPNCPITAIGHGNAIQLFDRATGKPHLDFAGHRETPVISFGFGAGNVVNTLDSGRLFQWDAETGHVRRHLQIAATGVINSRFRWHSGLNGSMVSPDKELLLKDADKITTLHDLKSGKLVRTLERGASNRWSSFFSANGARLISMEEKRIVSYDVATGRRLAAIDHEYDSMAWLFGYGPSCKSVVSPLGTYFAKSDKCLDVDLIRLDSGKPVRKLSADKGGGPDKRFAIVQLWFSPDERFVLAEVRRMLKGDAGGESAELAIWDAQRGTIVQEVMIVPWMQVWHRATLQGRSLSAVAMSTDRRLIALARRDHGDIEIWDTASATRRGVLTGHEAAITDLAFSRDGRYLASASEDTTVLVWDLNRPLNAVNLKDNLTEAEVAAQWGRLAEPDAAKADTSIWRLVKAKGPAIAFLKTHLRPQNRPDPRHVKRLIDDLDSRDFKTRSLARPPSNVLACSC